MPVLQGNCNLRKPGSVSLPFLFFVGFFFFFFLSRNTYSAGECGMQWWSAGTLKPNCPDSNLSCVDLASSLTCLCACLLTCIWGNESVSLAEELWGLCNTVHSAMSALLSQHTPGAGQLRGITYRPQPRVTYFIPDRASPPVPLL